MLYEHLLYIPLLILAIIWSRFDSSMRVYSVDGMCFVLSVDKSGSLILIDVETNGFRTSIMNTDNKDADAEADDFEQDYEQPDQVIVYGSASSFNGLYDCVLYTKSKIYDVNYRTSKDESCSISIRPILDSNDDMVLEDIVKCLETPLKVFNSVYNLWDVYELFKTCDPKILLNIQSHLTSKSREIVSKTMQGSIQTHFFQAHKLACYTSLLRVSTFSLIKRPDL